MKITTARKCKLVSDTGFGGYDLCINPYVGCKFGCKYCYVRFFIKDEDEPWGNFLRVRSFLKEKLSKEIPNAQNQRVVLGTMTDPYQPQERKSRLTRECIKQLKGQAKEIGLFTRSPIVLDDTDLLVEAKVRVHLTITPFSKDVLKKIEPIPIPTKVRFKVLKKLVEAGVDCHVCVSPTLPILSDGYRKEFIEQLAEIKPNGFTIDPMQCYGPSFRAVDESMGDDKEWIRCREIIRDKKLYKRWKAVDKWLWMKAWNKYKYDTFAIIMDHQSKKRYSLTTGDEFDFLDFNY